MSGKINISMMHFAYFAGMESGLTNRLEVESKQYHDDIIIPILLQSGIDQINFIGGIPTKIGDQEFLQKKIKDISFDKYHLIQKSIEPLIESYLLKGVSANDTDIYMINQFLSDLLFSISNKSSMLSLRNFPNLEKYRNILNPQFLLSLDLLFSNIEYKSVSTPISSIDISQKNIKLFYEIIESDLYKSFSSRNTAVDNSISIDALTINNIDKSATKLVSHFPHQLNKVHKTLSYLPLATKLISVFTNLIPSSIPDIVHETIEMVSKNRNSLRIYNISDFYYDYIKSIYSKEINI